MVVVWLVVVVDVKGKAANEDAEEEVRNQIKKRLSSGKVTEHALRSGGDGKAAAIERREVQLKICRKISRVYLIAEACESTHCLCTS